MFWPPTIKESKNTFEVNHCVGLLPTLSSQERRRLYVESIYNKQLGILLMILHNPCPDKRVKINARISSVVCLSSFAGICISLGVVVVTLSALSKNFSKNTK